MFPRVRPVPTFYALVYALTVPFYALSLASGLELLPKLPVSALSVICPAAAALLVTWRLEGAEAARALARRAWDARRIRSIMRCALGVVASPAALWLGYALPALRSGTLSVTHIGPLELARLCALFFLGAVGEELGWTGFAVERRRARGLLRAGVEVGVMWAAWHVLPLLSVGRSVSFVAFWVIGCVALRCVLVWLYEISGGSVLATVIAHALHNLVWMLIPVYGSSYDALADALSASALALTIVLLYAPAWQSRDRMHP
jgi:hypothetical protein